MSATAAEIERDSEQHRAKVAALVDELRDRVSPGEIANQLLGPDAGADLVRLAGRFARRQLRQNPVPVALIGAGVAWLLLANGLRQQRAIPLHDGLDYEELHDFQARPSGILRGATRVMRSLEASAKARLSASDVQEVSMATAHSHTNGNGNTRHATASSLMERTTEMARRTGRAAGNTASRTGSGIGQLAREQPLLVASIGFALGVALGALIPLSRMENDLLGEQAEKLKDSAKELASEGYERVKSVAQRTYDAATETLKSGDENTGSQTGSSAGGATGTSYGSDDGGDTGTATYRH
jgi:hypothetical protein